jgi:EspG family
MPLRLTDRQLAVAVALVEAPGHALLDRPDAQAQLAALRQTGVIGPDGVPDPEDAATLRVIARALVRVELRRSAGDEASELRAWADEDDAVTGVVDGEAVELRRAPREALPQALVRAAGLADDPGPRDGDGRAPVPVAGAALLAARERLRAGDSAAALDGLVAAGLAGRTAGEALAIAGGIRLAFVAQGSWREPDGEWHTGSVAALDAGVAGWWSFVPGAADGALEPTDAHALSARLIGLLP